MTLEFERNAYILVGKRILKSNLSQNKETLQSYKRDIIAAHNRFVHYVSGRFEKVTDKHKDVYRKNLNYVRDKTRNCFAKLKVDFQFTDDIFQFIDENVAVFASGSNKHDGDTESDDTDDFDEEVVNSDDNRESEDNQDNDDNREHKSNQSDGDNLDDNTDEMAITVVEFLNFATKIVPEYDGTHANFQGFVDAVNLANASVDTHTPSFIALIKSKLKGSARGYVSNENTVAAIILALETNSRSESASLIESKLMNTPQAKKKSNDYVKEVESLTAELQRAHITEGIPIAAAAVLATNSAVKAMRKNASNEKVKLLMEAGTFRHLNEAVEKFVSLSNSENSNNSNNASINFINKRQNNYVHRGNRRGNRGYRRGGNQWNSYNSNYRFNNYQGSNSRGSYRNNDGRRGYHSYNNNRRSNAIRFVDANRDESDSGNRSGPQQLMLRDA